MSSEAQRAKATNGLDRGSAKHVAVESARELLGDFEIKKLVIPQNSVIIILTKGNRHRVVDQ